MTSKLLLRVIANTVSTVDRVGLIVKEVMHSGKLGIVDKAVDDLQTEADRSAQRCIVASLAKNFPKITVIGEEGHLDDKVQIPEDWVVGKFDGEVMSQQIGSNYDEVKEEDIVAWVDPLDGTKEYTQGLLDHVTVLVGFAIGGKAVAGVIHQPFYNYLNEKDPFKQGRTMWGVVGHGVHGITKTDPPTGKVIVTTTRSHSSPTINSCIEAMKPDDVVRVGGAGHKVLLLIEGNAHAYVFPSPGCKKWDTCAPEAILLASGGELTDIHGDKIQYHAQVEHPNWGGVLASANASEHDKFLNQIPESVRDVLPIAGKPNKL